MEMKNAVIVSACRTAVGKMGGSLKPLHALDMSVPLIQEVVKRSGIDANNIDEVVFGQCRQTSDEPNLARVAALKAGLPEKVAGHTVMRMCASAMTAVHTGAQQIMTGCSDAVIVGGAESMSNGIFYVRDGRYGFGNGNVEFVDAITESPFHTQPMDMYGKFGMGDTAENIAKKHGITREEQDIFAYNSQIKALAAIDAGKFKDEIVPLTIPGGKKKPDFIFDTDEFPRRDISMEGLAKLKPAFDHSEAGTVTAGNSCGRNDGASAMLLVEEEKAKEWGLKPLARIIGMGTAGCDPRTMGLGPVFAAPKALKMAGLTIDDIGLIELNEAFAAQSLGVIKELGWENKMDIINVNGGAIALGHPLGSTGCRLLVTLLHEMQRRNVKYGLATLCIGGGQGQATVIELL